MCCGSGMKASLKLRDDERRPLLLKAKIPLTVGGLPFFSAVSAGASADDIQLDLGTAFPSVPSARLSYRPNDPVNPFLLSLRSGAFGSHSPLSFHVDFNPLRGGPPSFSLHFKPRLGDFSLRKLITSSSPKARAVFEEPEDRFAPVKRTLEGAEVHARSVLPLRSGGAAVRFRWGVRVAPAEICGLFSEKRVNAFPLLAMNKISVELVQSEAETMMTEKKKKKKKEEEEEKLSENVSVLVREHMDALKAENGLLRKAVEELRMEVVGGKAAVGELRGADAGKIREQEGRNGTRGAVVVAGNRGGRRSEKKEDAVA